MAKRTSFYVIISILLSVLLMGLLLSRIEAKELAETLTHIFLPALLAYMAIALLGAVLRAWRYKIFLSPRPIRRRDLLMATFIRNSFVDLLPARIGSLSFIYVLNKRLDFAFEAATSAFVASFVYDFLTLSPFVVAAVIAVGLGAVSISTPALLIVAGIFFAVWILILWKLIPFFTFALAVYGRILGILKWTDKKWAVVSVEKIRATIESLALIQGKRLAVPIFVLSLGIRAAKYVSLYFLLFALLRSLGFGMTGLSFWKLILGITGAEITSVLPVKGLAGFGTWESAWALTMGMMGFEQRIAILSGLGVHLVTNLFEYALGIGSLLILALPLLKKRSPK
ncbi:MAG: flippase-like domain-containing protein [Candidatus Aminicenantes bacterium]|nr:flippase-like domain-containing protein [Candidatus Aminicenantes bacterium]